MVFSLVGNESTFSSAEKWLAWSAILFSLAHPFSENVFARTFHHVNICSFSLQKTQVYFHLEFLIGLFNWSYFCEGDGMATAHGCQEMWDCSLYFWPPVRYLLHLSEQWGWISCRWRYLSWMIACCFFECVKFLIIHGNETTFIWDK